MGIKGLNKYIRDNCVKSTKNINISYLKGNNIVIDTSIYLYRFKANGNMLEGLYQMINLFKYHKVGILFVFDGIPPVEKRNTITERKKQRDSAVIQLQNIEKDLASGKVEYDNSIYQQIHTLKRSGIKVTQKDFDDAKELINSLGIYWVEAVGEADKLCAKLVNCGIAYACLSDDTDMFAYSCNKIIRYLSIMNETAILYSIPHMLAEININEKDFLKICILSGTDYNKENTNMSFSENMNLYHNIEDKPFVLNLYMERVLGKNWNTIYENICNIYNLETIHIPKNWYLKPWNKEVDKSKVHSILSKKANFIFV